MHQRIAELAALMDRTGRFRRHMARNAAGERELPEKLAHALGALGNLRIDFAIDAFEIGIGDHARASVSRSADMDHVEIGLADHAVEMSVDEVETGRRAPMTEQPRLDVLCLQRLAQKRIVEQVDCPTDR